MDDFITPGQKLYEQARRYADALEYYLVPWESLSRHEREEWEQQAYDQEEADRAP